MAQALSGAGVHIKEPLIYFHMSRAVSQIGKITTRMAQIVTETLTPSRTDKRAPDLIATTSLVTSKICAMERDGTGHSIQFRNLFSQRVIPQ